MAGQDDILVREFEACDVKKTLELIWETINTCYPAVYSPEAITYWEDIHTEEKILSDAKTGTIIVLESRDSIVATGTLLGHRISRVYVQPDKQGQGFGKIIMRDLEEKAKQKGLAEVKLYASLVSKKFYDAIGYETIRKTFLEIKGRRLDYFDMKKRL